MMLWFRLPTVVILAVVVLLPVGVVVYQSFLDEPFFAAAARLSLESYRFILAEPDFARAFLTSFLLAAGMTAIAVPFGGVLAFLVVRTDLPGKSWIEPALLVPIVLSPIVIAFGYVISVGPVGFVSLAVKQLIGFVPWNLYSLGSLIVIAGLTHVPHVYLFSSASLRKLNLELEEQARVMGAAPWRVALTVSLPLIWPALVYSGVLIFFLGFELFGLPLIIGDPANVLVLTTYLFKLTNIMGTPSYQLMAVVVVAIALVTLPLVYLQRYLLRMAERYVTMGGKGMHSRPLRLGPWRWVALACIVLWLLLAIGLPLAGVLLRAFVDRWGEGINPFESLTLQNFRDLAEHPNLIGAIANTCFLATAGAGASVAVYAVIALATHRWKSRFVAMVDYLVLLPRSMPGLVAGLAFLWVFLFVPYLGALRSSIVGLWLAYSTVWLAFGLRLISASLSQISPDLEEAARVTGARPGRALRDVTLPLIRFGLVSSWLLCFMIFVREYSTGVYLQGPGTEVLGPLIVSLFGGGSLELVAALSVVNVVLVAAGLALALRLGVRL
jgi:iron(III) transport system permease protein